MTPDELSFLHVGLILIGLHTLLQVSTSFTAMVIELLKSVGRYLAGTWKPDPVRLRAKAELDIASELDRGRGR